MEPYWWAGTPLPQLEPRPVAPTSDAVIVGAGYTGLSAAVALARAGRSVQVFDRQHPGEGASTRNGGVASGNLRPSYANLIRRYGEKRATAIQAEAKEAREELIRFIAEEGIDCDFSLSGRFTGAMSARDYETLAREADLLRRNLNIDAHPLPRSEQRSVLGTDLYHGGSFRMDIGGLDPAKLHAGMLALALKAGAVVHADTPVTGIARDGGSFDVKTARGPVRSRDVIVGTNGYTDGVDPWLRTRLVPVRSRIIATAPLPNDLMHRLLPRGMMCTDTRNLSYYYRPSPDGQRILFGGRDGTLSADPSWPTTNLRKAMVDVFPELESVELTHSWFGYIAMNRDMVPRIFSRKGVHYAAGYCGSGVVWARWLGQKAALQVLGKPAGQSALDFRPPRWVPLVNGRAWFMPAVFAWLAFKDRIARRV